MLNEWKYYEANKQVSLPVDGYYDVWNKAFSNFKIKISIIPVLVLGERDVEKGKEYAFTAFINPKMHAPKGKNRLVKVIISHIGVEYKVVSMEDEL